MGGGERGGRSSFAIRRPENQGIAERKPKTLADYGEKTKVFTSFHAEDEAQVNFLRGQAKEGKLEFSDYSVKEPFDEKWKTQCAERIEKADMVIVMIGPETYKREAVDWEIRKAIELGKSVIGVRIYRDQNHPIPKALQENGAKIIYWNLDDIQREIDKN
jgi:hypothetical protein